MMGVSSIGSSTSFAPYTTPLNGGPTVAQPTQQADQTQQVQAAEQSRNAQDQQARNSDAAAGTSAGTGYTTATRGQNLNITV